LTAAAYINIAVKINRGKRTLLQPV